MFKPAFHPHAVQILRARLDGAFHLPGEAGFDAGRAAWNLAADQHPVAVAEVASVADVQAVVRFAASFDGVEVAPQGPGHNPAAIASLDHAILLRTGGLRGLDVDAGQQVARVAAGHLMTELVEAAHAHGLAPVSGSTGDVGAVSFTLGGGIGWLSRTLGLAAEHVLAAEVVLADGSVVRCSADEHPELHWAVRGGGGSFGVVTALELRLHPVASVFGGMSVWPIERSAEITHAWRRWTTTAPDAVTTSLRLLQFPPLEQIPEPFRGGAFVVVDGAVLGDEAFGEAVLADLRDLEPMLDTWATVPATALPLIHMDPPEPTPAVSDHVLLDALDEDAVEAFLAAAGPGSGSPLMVAEIRHLGGALARRDRAGGALGRLDAPYATFACAIPVPEIVPAIEAVFAQLRTALAPWTAERVYANFAERVTSTEELFDPTTTARLRALKAELDPRGLLRPGHAVEADRT